jgi:hypothetical protein
MVTSIEIRALRAIIAAGYGTIDGGSVCSRGKWRYTPLMLGAHGVSERWTYATVNALLVRGLIGISDGRVYPTLAAHTVVALAKE